MSTFADFRSKNTVASLKTGAPVISHLPENLFASQQFHKLALAIEDRIPAKKRGRILTVSGVDTTVGKTLTSLNVTIALAREGERKALLIEGDLWRPGLAQYLESHPSLPGLSHVLNDSSVLSKAILSLGDTGCDVLLAGEKSSGKDLVCSRRMAELIVWAGSRYEFVVIDCPPLGTAAAQYLVKISHGTAIVVGAGKTKKRHLEHALEDLGPQKVLGFILNGVRLADLSYYASPSVSSPRGRVARLSVAPALPGDGSGFGRHEKKGNTRVSRRWRNILLVLAAILFAALVGLSATRWRPNWLFGWLSTGSQDTVEPILAVTAPPKAAPETLQSPEPRAAEVEKRPEPAPSQVRTHRLDVPSRVASARVTTRLNLRSKPGTEREVITTLPVGLDLKIAAFQSDWLKVSVGEVEGWVHRSGVQIEFLGPSGGQLAPSLSPSGGAPTAAGAAMETGS